MAEANEDVKVTAPVADVQPQEEQPAVSEDVKTPEAVDKKVYESVREAMKREREERKAKEVKVAELEKRLQELESAKAEPVYEPETQEDVRTKAKVDILYLVQTDPFVKDNLTLIQEKMEENSRLTAREAVKELKSDFFDRMQKEISRAEPEVPPKQLNPKGTTEEPKGNVLKDALEGRIASADPLQLEAYKRVLERLNK